MPISLDTYTVAASTSVGTSRTFSHTVGTAKSNRVLFVCVSLGSTDPPYSITVTYGGVSMSLAVSVTGSTDAQYAGIYYLVNPPTGANNVVVSWSNNSSGTFTALSLYGVSQSSPYYASSPTTGTEDTASPASLTVPVLAGGWAIDAVTTGNVDTGLTVGAGQTQMANNSTWHGASSYEAWTSGSTITMSWTKTVNRIDIHAALSALPAASLVSPAISPHLRF